MPKVEDLWPGLQLHPQALVLIQNEILLTLLQRLRSESDGLSLVGGQLNRALCRDSIEVHL